MLCKDNMVSFDYKSKKNNTKHIFPSFLPFFKKRKKKEKEKKKGVTKTTYHEIHECYAMQFLIAKRKQINKRWMVIKSIEMKHKDHVRRTQLDWAFCIQNFLDATLALELLFILEWWATSGLV